MAKIDKETFAKAIHDLCVAAGVKCNHRAWSAPNVKRAPTSRPARRNLTVSEAAAIGGRPKQNLTISEAAQMLRR